MLLTVKTVPSRTTSKLTRGLSPWRERRSRHQQHPLLSLLASGSCSSQGCSLSPDTVSVEQGRKQGVPGRSCLTLALLPHPVPVSQAGRYYPPSPPRTQLLRFEGSEVLGGQESSASVHHFICFHCLEVTSAGSQLHLWH